MGGGDSVDDDGGDSGGGGGNGGDGGGGNGDGSGDGDGDGSGDGDGDGDGGVGNSFGATLPLKTIFPYDYKKTHIRNHYITSIICLIFVISSTQAPTHRPLSVVRFTLNIVTR